MAVNYIRFKQFSLLWDHYAFIDVPAYLADQLFFKHRVTVHFGEELHHPEAGYMMRTACMPPPTSKLTRLL